MLPCEEDEIMSVFTPLQFLSEICVQHTLNYTLYSKLCCFETALYLSSLITFYVQLPRFVLLLNYASF